MNQDPEREAALDSIEAIRSILIRTTRYTHISALGIVLAGLTGSAAGLAGRFAGLSPSENPAAFLALWTAAFVVAVSEGVLTSWSKARREGETFWNRKLQFVVTGFSPVFTAGLVFTAVLFDTGALELAPGVWMALYGLAILAVSTVLDWEFQVLGWSFLVASATALFLLRGAPHASLTLGFGGIHVALGLYRFAKEKRGR